MKSDEDVGAEMLALPAKCLISKRILIWKRGILSYMYVMEHVKIDISKSGLSRFLERTSETSRATKSPQVHW